MFDKLVTDKQVILDKIFYTIKDNSSLLLTYFNQHCFNIYFKNNNYKNLIDDSFFVYSEGIGMFIFLWLILKRKVKRIDATFLYDLMEEISKRAENVFIIGGKFNEEELRRNLREKGINLTGYHNGYFMEKEKDSILKKITLEKTRIIFVGMGVPKQEFFAYELSKSSNDKVIICVGNFQEFYFGRIKRAPLIFQKLGIEWLFRLISEPGRLWRRYLIGIPEFLYRVIKIKLRGLV